MKPSPRHVVIFNDFSEARGGATGLAILSAQLLHARGVRVTFVSGDGGEGRALRSRGIEHIALGGTRLTVDQSVLAGARALWNVTHQRAIESLLRELDGEGTVYHLHGWQKILSPSVFAALRRVRERLVLHAHDFFLVCPNGTFMDFPRRTVCHRTPLSAPCLATNCDRRRPAHKAYRVLRQVVQNQASGIPLDAATVLMIHPAMRPYFVRAGVPDERLVTVLNPAIPLCQTRVHAEHNRTFFYVGRIEPEKGVLEFAAAAQRARVDACVIGEGSLAGELRRCFPEVRLEGWRDRAELGPLVSKARCLVMPSQLPEPFGLIAAEAAQSGIPVLASRHGFLTLDLERVGAGLTLPAEEPEFAALLERVACDDELVEGMSVRGFELAWQLSSTRDSWCDALLEHYRHALTRARGRSEQNVEAGGAAGEQEMERTDEDSTSQCQI